MEQDGKLAKGTQKMAEGDGFGGKLLIHFTTTCHTESPASFPVFGISNTSLAATLKRFYLGSASLTTLL